MKHLVETSKRLAALALVLLLPGAASAGVLVLEQYLTPAGGNNFRTSNPGDGIAATGGWANGGLDLEWDITEDGGIWRYSYKFRTPADVGGSGFIPPLPDLSHWILEVSPSITPNNLADVIFDTNFEIEDGDPRVYGTGASNPGIPGDIYGIKSETGTCSVAESPDECDEDFFEYIFSSTRAPIWGDFYAKDGKAGGNDVYAFNTGFGTDPDESTESFWDWIPVPDTTDGNGQVPEPGTLLLIATGLFALGARRRR